MTLYKLEAQKVRNEYKWRNTYFFATELPASIAAFATALIELETQIHIPTVQLTTYSVRNMDSPAVAPMEIPVNQFCTRTVELSPLAPFNVARVDLQTDAYAGQKEYRYSLQEADVNNWAISPGYIDEIEALFNDFIANIPVDVNWLTAGGFTIVVAQVYPYVQNRQLHRKRRPLPAP